jgi:hypothetical protein
MCMFYTFKCDVCCNPLKRKQLYFITVPSASSTSVSTFPRTLQQHKLQYNNTGTRTCAFSMIVLSSNNDHTL